MDRWVGEQVIRQRRAHVGTAVVEGRVETVAQRIFGALLSQPDLIGVQQANGHQKRKVRTHRPEEVHFKPGLRCEQAENDDVRENVEHH